VNEQKQDPAIPLISASDELLALAQEAGRLGIFEWRVPSGLLLLSPQLLSIYGLREFDGRYESWVKCLFREDVVRISGLTEQIFAERQRESSTEFRIIRPNDGALVWIEARSINFYGQDGAPTRVVGVNVDITERKRAIVQLRGFTESLEDAVKARTRELEAENEARLKAEESLRQAQKMEAVGQLTGGVAHDFNNLLTIVLGGLDSIGRQLPSLGASPTAERIARGRNMAVEGAKRAVTLTSRLLAFSRRQPLDPKPVDVSKLISNIGVLLHRTLGEQISLEMVLGAGLWRIHADPNQLESALLNLALNARDAMPKGGKVTIETANCYLDEAYIADLPEPVEAGQYVIRVYSELEEGTVVKIYLPRYVGSNKAASDQGVSRLLPHAIGDEVILVVEDDDALRAYTMEILAELGYHVLEAAHGAAALEVVHERDDIKLLFTDIVMPGGLNGRELAEQARQLRPGLKVLFTTGYTRNAVVHHGRLDPGVQLIGKPFSFEDLAAKVRALLDRDH
jgi:PAS domain S-box-containing protein